MKKDPRDIVIENLMKEVKFAMTRDIVTITENLKAFRKIRAGKQAKRKAKRVAFNLYESSVCFEECLSLLPIFVDIL